MMFTVLTNFYGLRGSCILVYLQYPCHLRLLAILEPHQWWWALQLRFFPGTVSLVPVPDRRGSYERGSRSTLVYRLELFSSLNVLSIWVPGHNNVPGMLLHIMAVRFTSSFSYLDIVLFSVITLCLFCHNDGWLLHTRILSCGGYAFFQVYKNLK